MGKKYSINSAGYIVAERDIYSLGGFIPRGSVGGKVASEKQLSQDGECWLGGGISPLMGMSVSVIMLFKRLDCSC